MTGQRRLDSIDCPVEHRVHASFHDSVRSLALVQEHAGDSPAAANGIFVIITFLASSSVVMLISLIADRTGLQTAYLISTAAGLVGIPLILMLPGQAGS